MQETTHASAHSHSGAGQGGWHTHPHYDARMRMMGMRGLRSRGGHPILRLAILGGIGYGIFKLGQVSGGKDEVAGGK